MAAKIKLQQKHLQNISKYHLMKILVRENRLLKTKTDLAVAANIPVMPSQQTGLFSLCLNQNLSGGQLDTMIEERKM